MTLRASLGEALWPLARLLPAEPAHRAGLWALRHGFAPGGGDAARAGESAGTGAPALAGESALACGRWGLDFANPIGLAAGFDKDGVAVDGARALGFGFIEIGTVTPRPQKGNPTPRMFRLSADGAVINRLGFNNHGHAALSARLRARPVEPGAAPIGVNLGANRDSADPAADYVAGIQLFSDLADYLVINISSPNTPGLRDLQHRARLRDLLRRLDEARAKGAVAADARPPLLLKVAPDLAQGEPEDIAEAALEFGLDGLIVSNTTIARPDTLTSARRDEVGGLSGRPLFGPSTRLLARFHRLIDGRLPLIGCGGVASGADAYAKIRAGASLVQLYTALAFNGPGLVRRIRAELAALLARDGITHIDDAVGADAADMGEEGKG